MLIAPNIFRRTLSALIMILVSLTLIVWLNGMLRDIRLLTSQGQTFLLFLETTALFIPKLLAFVAPIAFLIASLHTLNRLNGDSELIVLSASGSSAWRLLSTILRLQRSFSPLSSLRTLCVPPSEKLFNDLSPEQGPTCSPRCFGQRVHRPRSWPRFSYARKGRNGDLLGVVVRDERDKTTINTIVAERGQIWSDSGRAQMDLHDGEIVRRQAKVTLMCNRSISIHIPSIWATSAKAGKREPRVGELSMSELLHMDKESDYYKRNGAAITSDIHQAAFHAALFLGICVARGCLSGWPRTTREGRIGTLFTGFMIGALAHWRSDRQYQPRRNASKCAFAGLRRTYCRISSHLRPNASFRSPVLPPRSHCPACGCHSGLAGAKGAAGDAA